MKWFDVLYTIITYTASSCSVCMNASPLMTIRRVEQAGTVGAMTVTFFGAQMYSGATWGTYGVFTNTKPMLMANTVGLIVSTLCILTYLSVARREERSGHKLRCTTYARSLATVVFFAAISWGHLAMCLSLTLSHKSELALYITGYEASVASLMMLGSPLMMFTYIVRTKSAETLAPLTITFGFFNTLLWFIAGLMIHNFFIIIPNIFTWTACCCQFALLFIYGRKKDKKVEVRQAIAPVPFD